jgi:hypothetical protein
MLSGENSPSHHQSEMTRKSGECRTGVLTTRSFISVEERAVAQEQEEFRSLGIE